MRINEALRFLDARLEQIEELASQKRPDDSDKILKQLDKVIKELEKEVDKIVKELEKMLKDYEDWLDGLDEDQLKLLFDILSWMIKNDVEINEDGVWVDGELVIDIDDGLAGLCCPFG